LIPQGSKETVIEAIDTAVRAGARQTRACEIVGITLEMASRIPPFVAIKRDPPGEKNYLSFFSEILYDTPSREKTCA
jgi:hypothetical protein